MSKSDRREFLQESGLILGFVALAQISSHADPLILRSRIKNGILTVLENKSGKTPPPLFNTNVQTAIGLGDETPGIVDQFGQLDSRNAKVSLEIGTTPQKSSDFQWLQSLEDGYLPIVDIEARSSQGSVCWSAYASNVENTAAECLEVTRADLPYKVRLRFPYTTKIEVRDGVVTSGDQVLALFPATEKIAVSQAKYNLLTPERDTWSLSRDPFSQKPPAGYHPRLIPGIDPAFSSGRTSMLFRPLQYSFPVQPGKTYHVILGLIVADGSDSTQTLMKLSADDMSDTVNMANSAPGKPILCDFVVKATKPEIRVISATDPSSTSKYRQTLLNAIWIFDELADLDQVKTGTFTEKALFYVRCGEEPIEDAACSVTLDYSMLGANAAKRQIYLPYNLSLASHDKSMALRSSSTKAFAKQIWEPFIQRGSQFITGDDRLDGLYKTSLINIFLLRAKYPGMANGGQDLYVVKPGATVYDAFWYRDAAYLTTALDVAGYSEEAEKSLRLFWQSNLPGDFGALGQQEGGTWQVPMNEFDGQGQALWALVHHSQFSSDREWLKLVYPNIRKGALWIKNVTEETRVLAEKGDRPIYYGLLPAGEGEAIGGGYNYYHDYWALLGLQMANEVAAALNEEQDVIWLTQTYNTFRANLLSSIKQAFERVGLNKYIPATPFHSISQYDIWGSIAALYPTRFLEPNDPMMSKTLDLMSSNCQEDEYTYFVRKKLWTYITVDWAMCYLLRGDLAMFFRLFDGYVAHASPTNGWIEEIFLDTHLGTGDMPHGWAAAQYVHLHRNALVFEDKGALHLCWGAREDWLKNGITVKRAPTKFGTIDFEIHRTGRTLVLDYKFVRGANRETCRQVQLHIPPSTEQTVSVRVNGKVRVLSPDQHMIQLE